MSATTVINSSISPGQSVSGTFMTSAPFRGVEIVQEQTMAQPTFPGVLVSYQISLDNGTTWSDAQPVQHEANASISGSGNSSSILLNEFATTVKFNATNTNRAVACASFVLEAECFT